MWKIKYRGGGQAIGYKSQYIVSPVKFETMDEAIAYGKERMKPGSMSSASWKNGFKVFVEKD